MEVLLMHSLKLWFFSERLYKRDTQSPIKIMNRPPTICGIQVHLVSIAVNLSGSPPRAVTEEDTTLEAVSVGTPTGPGANRCRVVN